MKKLTTYSMAYRAAVEAADRQQGLSLDFDDTSLTGGVRLTSKTLVQAARQRVAQHYEVTADMSEGDIHRLLFAMPDAPGPAGSPAQTPETFRDLWDRCAAGRYGSRWHYARMHRTISYRRERSPIRPKWEPVRSPQDHLLPYPFAQPFR